MQKQHTVGWHNVGCALADNALVLAAASLAPQRREGIHNGADPGAKRGLGRGLPEQKRADGAGVVRLSGARGELEISPALLHNVRKSRRLTGVCQIEVLDDCKSVHVKLPASMHQKWPSQMRQSITRKCKTGTEKAKRETRDEGGPLRPGCLRRTAESSWT